ncbi:hypothetical protein [Algisphaera agarilytica]|uniref:Uncharacterized protein n=1 Tax=Algisphaera agarilytica TaxID=1385975 RepID=A0A7X0H4Q2_9BACT|nr:hypothetical protein [Algisphaera agarilytica]MBB6429221.1 hypothetical protein [Algisphaera agarilytica]
MSRVTRNDVLKAFVAVVESTGVTTEADAKKKGKDDKTRAMVFFHRHVQTQADGMERHNMIVVVTLRHLDDPTLDGAEQTELLRLSDAFQAIEDAIDAANEDPAGTPFESVKIAVSNNPNKPGTEADGYDDDDRRARIGQQYDVTWKTTSE